MAARDPGRNARPVWPRSSAAGRSRPVRPRASGRCAGPGRRWPDRRVTSRRPRHTAPAVPRPGSARPRGLAGERSGAAARAARQMRLARRIRAELQADWTPGREVRRRGEAAAAGRGDAAGTRRATPGMARSRRRTVWVTGLPNGSQAGGAANPSSHAGPLDRAGSARRARRRSQSTRPAASNSRLASGRAA